MRKPFHAFLVSRSSMDPLRGEVDDLPLMDPEDTMHTSRQKQRQMGERAEPAVTQEDVVLAKLGMDLRHSGHVMGAQRGGQDLHEHPRTDMEQRQKMGHGEAAARLLRARLAKVLLKFRCVGHGEARAVGDEHAMPMPGPGIVDLGSEPCSHAAEQLLEQPHGQAAPTLAIGRVREGKAADSNQMIDGGIAMEDLGEEQVDERDGVEQTVAPGVIDLAAGVEDLRSIELLGGGLLESAKDANDPMMHDGLPGKVDFVYHLYDRERHFGQLTSGMGVVSIG
jgi:hypothetical protein